MNSKEVAELIAAHTSGVKIVNDKCLFATTNRQHYREAISTLKERGITRISAITGVDVGDMIESIYHFDCQPTELNLKVPLPKNDLKVQTITDLYPGAILYERELMEMFGVKVEGHPDPRRLFLPDDWPEGEYPLRKEWRENKK